MELGDIDGDGRYGVLDALLIQPVQPLIKDRANLLPPPVPTNDRAELQQQVQRMESVRDVDEELLGDEDLFRSLRDEMADVLASLRYGRDDYLKSEFSKHISEAVGDVFDGGHM